MKEIKNTLRKGEKPVFKKKCKIILTGRRHNLILFVSAEKRMEDLVSKFDELKKSNKLQKHFKRQNQKMMKKDRNLNSFLE